MSQPNLKNVRDLLERYGATAGNRKRKAEDAGVSADPLDRVYRRNGYRSMPNERQLERIAHLLDCTFMEVFTAFMWDFYPGLMAQAAQRVRVLVQNYSRCAPADQLSLDVMAEVLASKVRHIAQ